MDILGRSPATHQGLRVGVRGCALAQIWNEKICPCLKEPSADSTFEKFRNLRPCLGFPEQKLFICPAERQRRRERGRGGFAALHANEAA